MLFKIWDISYMQNLYFNGYIWFFQIMPPLSRLQKIIVGVGACGGVVVYFANYFSPNRRAYNSWTTSYTPTECARWDDNWDQ